jgi:hypothetical protein
MGGCERDIAKAAKGATLKKGLPINGEDVVLDVAISREIAYNKGA